MDELSATESKLLTLPAQLRNKIWEEAVTFTDDEGKPLKLIVKRGVPLSDAHIVINRPNTAMQPAITRVNRQIRAETLPIFYGTNHFCMYYATISRGWQADRAVKWLRGLGARAEMLRHLHADNPDTGLREEEVWSCKRWLASIGITVNEGSTAKLLEAVFEATQVADDYTPAWRTTDAVTCARTAVASGLARRFEGKGKTGMGVDDWIEVVKLIDEVFGVNAYSLCGARSSGLDSRYRLRRAHSEQQ